MAESFLLSGWWWQWLLWYYDDGHDVNDSDDDDGIDDDDDDNDGSVDPRMSGTHDAVVLGRTLPTSTNIGLSLGTPIMVMLMSREKQHKEEHWIMVIGMQFLTKYNDDVVVYLHDDDGEEEQKAGFFWLPQLLICINYLWR